jgi:hypothetical protein
MATTYTLLVDGTARNPNPQQVIEINDFLRLYRVQHNFAAQGLDAGLADVLQMLLIPGGSMVLKAWLRVITACAANATVDFGYGTTVNLFGNGLALDATGIVKTLLTGSDTWNAGSIADGDLESKDITVDGASMGDIAICGLGLDVADLGITGAVTVANVATATLWNNTGGAIDLASTTVTAYVNKAPLAVNPLLFSVADTLDIKATVDTADVNLTTGVIEVNALVMSINAHGF